jgi:putative ABC transport system permease protein
MRIVLHDCDQALRLLARKPAFTFVAVITLALGVGATTAIFTVLRGVVLDPLPQPEADRLVQVQSPVPGFDDDAVWGLSTAQYFFFNERSRTLETLGLYNVPEATVHIGGEPDRLRLGMVTPEVVDLVGVSPVLGRTLQAADGRPGAAPVAVLSHDYWQRRFGGDPEVIGRNAEVFGVSFEIVGVAARGVELPMGAGATPEARQRDLWIPFQLDPAGPHWNQHTNAAIARLAPGASLEEARRELAALSAGLSEAYPQVYDPAFMERFGFVTRPVDLREHVLGDISRNLWILFGAV